MADAVLYRWLDLVKSPDGPSDPVLRLVCLVLGGWCRDPAAPEASVSQRKLSDQVGITVRSVRERLQQLEGIWIEIDRSPGRRSVFRPLIPAGEASVPSVSEVRNGRGQSVENPDTPERRIRGVRSLDPGTTVPGWGVRSFRGPRNGGSGAIYTYLIPTPSLADARDGPGEPEGPAVAAPGADDDQLPMPRLLSQVTRALREDDREGLARATDQLRQVAGV